MGFEYQRWNQALCYEVRATRCSGADAWGLGSTSALTYCPIYHFSKKPYSQLQNKNDPNISFCPVDHPFIPVSKLEAEGQKLLEALTGLLYNSQYVELILSHLSLNGAFREIDLLSALLNSWVNLVKLRPATLPMVISTLRSWTPTALGGLSASSVKSIEKSIRILLVHISRYASKQISSCL